MSDYNSGNSVPPLIPGDIYQSDGIFTGSLKVGVPASEDPKGVVGFFGLAAVQQTPTLHTATVVIGSSTAVLIDTTFNGYTIRDIVLALQEYGLLA